jgi:uncharacterized protein
MSHLKFSWEDSMYKRDICKQLIARLTEPRRFIQVLDGPRQVGKTTLVQQAIGELPFRVHYASADKPSLEKIIWIEQQWEIGRLRVRESADTNSALLVLDEVQKVPNWSEMVKQLWDEDTRLGVSLKVVILGSSPLLLQTGLTESLAGRFERISVTHWSFSEMEAAFNWSLDQYIFYGGYPGAAPLIEDETRWSRYICDSLIETTISRDVLLLEPIKKPALLRQLFKLGTQYSGQILSFQKMLGQLSDAGNTTTLSHYLNLLNNVKLLVGIQKFTPNLVRERASSPKLQVYNTALISAQSNYSFQRVQENRDYWGRLVESAVGAYLLNRVLNSDIEVFYWRERNQEVDFVLRRGDSLLAIEVKSGGQKFALPGFAKFKERFGSAKFLLVGGQGISLNEFLRIPLEQII